MFREANSWSLSCLDSLVMHSYGVPVERTISIRNTSKVSLFTAYPSVESLHLVIEPVRLPICTCSTRCSYP